MTSLAKGTLPQLGFINVAFIDCEHFFDNWKIFFEKSDVVWKSSNIQKQSKLLWRPNGSIHIAGISGKKTLVDWYISIP